MGSKNPMWRDAKLHSRCKTCGVEFSYYRNASKGIYCSLKCCRLCESWRRLQSKSKSGRKHTDEARAKMSKARLGVKKSPAHAAALGAANRRRFIGHVSIQDEYHRIKSSAAYRKWTQDVILRDGKCKRCDAKSNTLDAHHLYPFSLIVEEFKMGLIKECDMHWMENGMTLCRCCHKAVHMELGGFTPIEVVLLRAIKRLWMQAGEPGVFADYYRSKMEHFIESVKSCLKPE